MSMNCDGCEYNGFVMRGDKKVSYCKYFRETKQNMDRTNYPPYYPFQHGYCLHWLQKPDEVCLDSPKSGTDCIFCGRFVVKGDITDNRMMCEECRQALSEMIAQYKGGDTP